MTPLRCLRLLSCRFAWIGLALVFVGFTLAAWGQSEVITQANKFELSGRFREAAAVLTVALAAHPNASTERTRLEFELNRLDWIRKDYPFNREQLFAELKKSIKDFSAVEFEQWIGEKRFDDREIDGEQRFMVASVSNLFFRYPELRARRLPPKNSAGIETLHWEVCRSIKQAALDEHRPYVLPKRFAVSMTVTADRNAAPDGEIVRAWLPIPREYPFQSEFQLVASEPAVTHTDDPQSAVRSVYFERPARKGLPTKFSIAYEYTAKGVWFDLNPETVQPVEAADTALLPYLKEAPHVVFTPQIRALSQQIAGGEANPCRKAKRFYDWIAGNIKYSFATEYSTIRNISDYCLSHGYGDCGQEALLFITLCRLNGIPARWQSGWNTFPGAKSIHDWTEIYLTPYGWIPVDPYMGIYAMQYATTLRPEQRREIRDFYFGGLDQYRIAANGDHSQVLNPPKRSSRSDNVDFQRGELEWGSHTIYFDEFSYELNATEVSSPPKRLE